jgi:hypothetical protein
MLTTLRPMVRHHRYIILGPWASSQRSEACSGIEDHDGPAKPAALWIRQCSCAHVPLPRQRAVPSVSNSLTRTAISIRWMRHWCFCSTLESGNSLQRMNRWHASESNRFLGDMKTSCIWSILHVDARLKVIVSHQGRTMIGRVTSWIDDIGD